MARYALISPGSKNTKTAKHAEYGFENAILHLAPASVSGFNMCPMASPGCAAACLNTAGRGGLSATQNARVRRSRYFSTDREFFMIDLVSDLELLVANGIGHGKRPVARLNGTSDVSWERIAVIRGGERFPHVFAAFPEIQFYDYTKVIGRIERCANIPNYSLTFSLSESNDAHACRALALGFNVAAVIRNPAETFAGYRVIDGEAHDFRFLDARGGCIVALSAKGKARHDTTGFVRDATDTLHPERTPRFAAQA